MMRLPCKSLPLIIIALDLKIDPIDLSLPKAKPKTKEKVSKQLFSFVSRINFMERDITKDCATYLIIELRSRRRVLPDKNSLPCWISDNFIYSAYKSHIRK